MLIFTKHEVLDKNIKTEKEWESSDKIPFYGEIIVYSDRIGTPLPFYKIGNNVHTVSELPFNRDMLSNEHNNLKSMEKCIKDNFSIYYKINGYEFWKDYNENRNLVHYKDSTEYEEFIEYDDDDRVIKVYNNKGYRKINKYNIDGSCNSTYTIDPLKG